MAGPAIRPDVQIDLFDVIPDSAADAPDFCNSRTYWRWEDATAKPLLEAIGHRVVMVFTGDGDSFGPLMRTFVTIKDGKRYELTYG